MLLRELFEAQARKIVAVMPGGFHPFHPGHKSLYDWAVKTFGQSNVYVAATNDTKARPFPFEVKKKLAAMAGVPENNFIQVKSPFNAMSYKDIVDADTALVFVRSQKDKNEQPLPDQTKKNGELGYLRTYTGKDLNTSDEMGYMAYGPTINFDFSGMQIKSASELRATWPEMSDEDKLKAAKLMYGNGAPVAVKLLDQALGDTEAPVGEAMPYTGKSPQYKGVRIPTDDTVDAKDITKKSKQVDMPDEPYELDFDNVDKEKLKKILPKIIDTLTIEKDKKVLLARFGLAPFKKEYTLNQIAKAMGVTLEVVRQREQRALRQLRHPSRSRDLRQFMRMEDVSPENEKKFHNELDDLVHKYFGDSPDEVKMKKKMRKVKEDDLNEAAPLVAAAIWIIKWAIRYGAWPVIKWLLKKHGGKIIGGAAAAYYIDQGWDWVKDKIGAEYAQMLIDNKFEIGMAVALIIGAVALKKYMEKQGDKLVKANEAMIEKAPPGREKQVKALKKKFDDPGAPYAIAWAQHNKKKRS